MERGMECLLRLKINLYQGFEQSQSLDIRRTRLFFRKKKKNRDLARDQ